MSDSLTLYSETVGKDAGIDWGFEHLLPLFKGSCVDIAKNPDTDHGQEEYGLVFKCRDGQYRTAWIMCDPEGNGAGHLHIYPKPKNKRGN